ncbi:MAG: SagB/ThcOx family dehydrogenase [Symploca sp. SIO2B6]|nr:SagB/ThcOx family dehydrogenase [Symploca sp. SIO2B6]
MTQPFVLHFKPNISRIEESTDHVIVQSPIANGNVPQYKLDIKQVSPGLLTVFRTLGNDGATEKDLSNLVLDADGFSELPKLYYYLQKFIDLGMICHTIVCEGYPLASRLPIYPTQKFQFTDIKIDQKYVLSRFAYSYKEQEQLVLSSPLVSAQIILANWKGAAVIAELTQPQTCQELCSRIPDISQQLMQLFLSLLLSTKMLCEVKMDGKTEEETNKNLVSWEFHDLLFHCRHRKGKHSYPTGKTFRFLDKLEQPPLAKTKMSNDIIELYRPDLKKLKDEDYSFTWVLEARQSIRSYKDEPITDRQLGEFLYRSARNKRIIYKDYGECTHRPYANGGGRYELELYTIINTCNNITSGIYHYCPQEHQLCRLSGRNSYVEALLEDAYFATGKASMPQVLFIYAARFSRIAWVYESIAYSMILKDVGCLQQTMYLVATAMNLAPCAIGCGNSDLFATAVGADYYEETSVGEFILGSNTEI